MKEAHLKRLHIIWSQDYDTVEKVKRQTVESDCQELERRMGWTGGAQRCLGSETVLYDTQWWTHVIIHLSKPRKCTLQRVTPNGNSGLQLITMHRIGHNGAFPMADKESACNAGDTGNAGLILGSGRSPGVGSGNLFQYSCLENPMNRGAWWATIHRVPKSQTQQCDWTHWRNQCTTRMRGVNNGESAGGEGSLSISINLNCSEK